MKSCFPGSRGGAGGFGEEDSRGAEGEREGGRAEQKTSRRTETPVGERGKEQEREGGEETGVKEA